ncbi:glutamine synthetase family protein [Aldersonia kunmingensis]|uniref:glutamine synthetase family protein n=1 Tax=Aldersonia kunmingensis TaxID=408066 RepID=UPI00316ABFD3
MRSVIGTTVNAAGVTLAKSVPVARAEAFEVTGMGASPVWHVFCIDRAIAFTDPITAVGDMRLRIDGEALRDIGGGLAWAPASYYSQDGEPEPACTRHLLSDMQRRLADDGLVAQVGHELEFVLVALDGHPLETPGWTPYGAGALLQRERFLADLVDATNAAGLPLEQIHAEYGRDQYEISLPRAEPLASADGVVLAKLIIGRIARSYGLLPSFSPLPFAGGVGNGAHQHLSLYRGDLPIFEGGSGPHDLTGDGGAAIGGLLALLPQIQALLCGSILSGARLGPGMWSGVHLCWGLENREAAVRLVRGGADNPAGANIEIKVIDPSANVYIATAALLAAADYGIRTGAALPDEVPDDPSKLSAAQLRGRGISLLPKDADAVLSALDGSPLVREMIGNAVVDAVVATRRHEQTTFTDREPGGLAELFRLSWTI